MPTIFYDLEEIGRLIARDMKEKHPQVPIKEPIQPQFKVSVDKATKQITAHGVVVPIGNAALPPTKEVTN